MEFSTNAFPGAGWLAYRQKRNGMSRAALGRVDLLNDVYNTSSKLNRSLRQRVRLLKMLTKPFQTQRNERRLKVYKLYSRSMDILQKRGKRSGIRSLSPALSNVAESVNMT